MEHMNKQQIILLALLVSFVSSIATAISVVSLMQQGETVPVTQTINHVIEKTIERVAADTAAPGGAGIATKETIVVKEDEAITEAIATASKGIATIYWIDQSGVERFVGLGVIASSSGRIISKTEVQYAGSYVGHLSGGNSVSLTLVSHDSMRDITVFQAEQGTNSSDLRVYNPATLADSTGLKVGQSIVVMGNTESTSVATGIISSIDSAQNIIHTSVKDADLREPAFALNLSGEIVGIKGSNGFDGGFIPDSIIKTYATP